MSPLLDHLLGNGGKDREQAEALRAILQEIQEERSRQEALVQTIRTSIERLGHLGEPIAKAGNDVDAVASRIAELEKRFAAMVQLVPRFEALDERAESLTQSQKRAESQVTTALDDAHKIRALFEELAQKVDLAMGLKDRLATFLDVEKPFQQLRTDAEALRGEVGGTGEHMTRLREQHDRLMDAHKLAMSKMEALDRRREELGRDLQDKERRVAGVEQALHGMDGVQQTVDDIRREIGTLKALGDNVAQKTAALEAQHEVVERALARSEDLDRAMRQIETGVRQQQENEKTLSGIEDQVATLRALQQAVIERSREISQFEREAGEQVRESREELSAVRDDLKRTTDRFEFETQGMESVSQRVADLRSALADFENRFKGLNESSQLVAELKSQTQSLVERLQAQSDEVGRVDGQIGKVQAIRRDLDEVGRSARDAGARIVRIEEARPAIDAALRDVEQLRSAHAMVKDALEQTQMAHGEIARAQGTQSETRSWLSGVEESVDQLKGQVEELRQMAPTVELVQKQAHRIHESMAAIEARRDFVEELQRRMTDLGALGGTLDERGRQLQSRMEAAEQRFSRLSAQSDEADRLGKAMADVSARLQEAERQADEIGKTVAANESRCDSVETIAEKTRALRQEIEQRQHALEQAALDLRRASELRQEAAASAQQLDETAKRLAASLASADKRVERVDTMSTQLEGRAAGLQQVEKRLTQFEERLIKWELVEQEIGRSLEQMLARQSTVEALQADLDRMFVTAEKTAADVRTITSAHHEIAASRQLLDEVMGRLREVRDTASGLDDRKRQMAKAEERLARADALLVEVRSSLESLHAQRTIVDQAVEKTGSLRILLKQAEGMVEELREERKLTADVRSSIAIVRAEDDEDLAQAA